MGCFAGQGSYCLFFQNVKSLKEDQPFTPAVSFQRRENEGPQVQNLILVHVS